MVELTAMWETDRTEYGGQETVKKGWYGDLLQFKLSFGPSNPSPGEQAEIEYRRWIWTLNRVEFFLWLLWPGDISIYLLCWVTQPSAEINWPDDSSKLLFQRILLYASEAPSSLHLFLVWQTSFGVNWTRKGSEEGSLGLRVMSLELPGKTPQGLVEWKVNRSSISPRWASQFRKKFLSANISVSQGCTSYLQLLAATYCLPNQRSENKHLLSPKFWKWHEDIWAKKASRKTEKLNVWETKRFGHAKCYNIRYYMSCHIVSHHWWHIWNQ